MSPAFIYLYKMIKIKLIGDGSSIKSQYPQFESKFESSLKNIFIFNVQ